jgi:hypothetical protein
MAMRGPILTKKEKFKTVQTPLARPHSLQPDKSTIRCVIAYKNFAANAGISHIGLGVAALNISQVLRQYGVWVDVWPILSAADLGARLDAENAKSISTGHLPISHVVISAPWIQISELTLLISKHQNVTFAVVSHSNVAFLHADPQGMALIKGMMDLQIQWHNFHLAANSSKFASWVSKAFRARLTILPNLYNTSTYLGPRPQYTGGTLRMGSFGAVRILKNHVTAAAAAVEVATRLGVDTEFWMSGGRNEGSGGVVNTIKQMVAGVRSFQFVFNVWENWAQFRKTVRSMNLLLQPSFTESFNMVTADGVVEGVPSVTSDSIEWVPENWKANPDNALDIANKAIGLLNDPQASQEGLEYLETHNERGVRKWLKYFLPQLREVISS